MDALLKSVAIATVLGLTGAAEHARAGDRVYVPQATSASKLVYVRQALELPDQRGARAAAARAQRAEQVQRTRTAQQARPTSDASMLELRPANVPALPAAHIAVD
ncbi:hypothetical protein [Roseovarius nanhaiticus]|uniref:hypothetical protein n=1 Tax=Roseovarius nanhaiticus TaxID=573024 RepID=UPI0024931343|nr:hypothetical protein [Roseovarius nanhaiticus]